MRNSMFAALAMSALVSTPSFAMSDSDCAAAWTKADPAKTGYLTDANGSRYLAAVRVSDKPMKDGKLSQEEFATYCKAGLFDVRTADAGAPMKGANSFTEAQAHDRAMAHGYSSVGKLVKDADGIWRGPAQRDGKATTVAVDFKGNVVSP